MLYTVLFHVIHAGNLYRVCKQRNTLLTTTLISCGSSHEQFQNCNLTADSKPNTYVYCRYEGNI